MLNTPRALSMESASSIVPGISTIPTLGMIMQDNGSASFFASMTVIGAEVAVRLVVSSAVAVRTCEPSVIVVVSHGIMKGATVTG